MMKLSRLLGFGNPWTDHLEAELVQALVERYKDNDKTFTGDIKTLSKNVRDEFKSQLKQWFMAEDEKVEKNWKEFKSIIKQQESDAIKLALKRSLIKNYSKEKSSEILAIPKKLLMKLTIYELPQLLKMKIQFADMDDETRQALSKYAVEIKFDNILNLLRKDNVILDIDYGEYILVDEIENDHYYIDDETTATRNIMIFFSKVEYIYSSSSQKEIKKETKKAIKKWEQHLKNRPDDRRFIFSNWET